MVLLSKYEGICVNLPLPVSNLHGLAAASLGNNDNYFGVIFGSNGL